MTMSTCLIAIQTDIDLQNLGSGSTQMKHCWLALSIGRTTIRWVGLRQRRHLIR